MSADFEAYNWASHGSKRKMVENYASGHAQFKVIEYEYVFKKVVDAK